MKVNDDLQPERKMSFNPQNKERRSEGLAFDNDIDSLTDAPYLKVPKRSKTGPIMDLY